MLRDVAPATAKAGATVALAVKGSGFEGGATANLEGAEGTPPEVTAVQFVSPTELVVTVVVPEGVLGTEMWDLQIINPDGSSAAMKDALTLRP